MFYGVSRDAHVHSVRHRKADRRIRLQVSRARDPPVVVQALLRGIQACLVLGEPREAHRSRADVARPAFSRNQLRMWQYLAAHPCVDCGERDPVVLHFDHLRDKRTDVSYMTLNGFKWDTILEEIAKCEIRFAYDEDGEGARYLGTKAHDIAHAIRL